MTAPESGRVKLTLRTTDTTADLIRGLQGLMTSRLGGRRLTQDDMIDALAILGSRFEAELADILRERGGRRE